MAVLLETSLGNLEIDLYTDEAPKGEIVMGNGSHLVLECLNFLKLCKIKYYNFSLLHKVMVSWLSPPYLTRPFYQKNFTILTGDPTGTGQGGISVWG